MEREYDLFEKVKGDLLWVCKVTGHEQAIAKLRELAAETKNELQVIHLPTKALIAVMNRPKSDAS